MSWKDGSVFAIADLKLVSSTHNGQLTTDCNCSLRGSDALFWPLLTCTYTCSHAGTHTLTNNYKYHTHNHNRYLHSKWRSSQKKAQLDTMQRSINHEEPRPVGTSAESCIHDSEDTSPKRGLEGCKSQNTRMSSVRLTLLKMAA